MEMRYELSATEDFERWLLALDGSLKRRLANRFLQVECGHFGDHKLLTECLYELRFTFGSGLRIYYVIRGLEIVLLLNGGNKASQKKDIAKAKALLQKLEA